MKQNTKILFLNTRNHWLDAVVNQHNNNMSNIVHQTKHGCCFSLCLLSITHTESDEKGHIRTYVNKWPSGSIEAASRWIIALLDWNNPCRFDHGDQIAMLLSQLVRHKRLATEHRFELARGFRSLSARFTWQTYG